MGSFFFVLCFISSLYKTVILFILVIFCVCALCNNKNPALGLFVFRLSSSVYRPSSLVKIKNEYFLKNKSFLLVVACGKGGKVVNFNFPLFHAFHKSFLSLVPRPSSLVIPQTAPKLGFATFLKNPLYILRLYKGFFCCKCCKTLFSL